MSCAMLKRVDLYGHVSEAAKTGRFSLNLTLASCLSTSTNPIFAFHFQHICFYSQCTLPSLSLIPVRDGQICFSLVQFHEQLCDSCWKFANFVAKSMKVFGGGILLFNSDYR